MMGEAGNITLQFGLCVSSEAKKKIAAGIPVITNFLLKKEW